MDAAEPARLDRLLRPRSVAIVGAAPDPNHMGGSVLNNLQRCGFAGDIHLVSRSRSEIAGRACVGSIDDLPHGVDVAVLVIPQAAVLDAIAACGRRGVGAAIVFAAGYAEVGEAGRAEQDLLAAAARAANVLLLGPNCIGMCGFAVGATLTFEFNVDRPPNVTPKIGIVAQSGAVAAIMRMAFIAKRLGVSFYISSGNEADLTAEDFLAALIEDADTQVVTLFLEQIRKPQQFLALAQRARALGKPIVLMHPGRSQRARTSASTHTGALAGDHAVMTALLGHVAVTVVDTLEELLDTAELLGRFAPPVNGPGIITNSGAIKGFALDFCDRIGLDIPLLGPDTLDALKAALPPFASLDNPIDVTAQVLRDPAIWTRSAQALLADAAIGSLCLPMVAGSPKVAMDKVNALLPAIMASRKPATIAVLGDDFPVPPEFTAAFRDNGIPVLRSPERAMRALAHATAYGRALAAAEPATPTSPAEWPAAPRGGPPEIAGKAYFRRIGIPVPDGLLANDLAAALRCAGELGYPAALKAQAEGLAHKSEVGGVMLNIRDAAALEQAWKQLQANLARHGIAGASILIERMADPGIEMIVGARRDPLWGPVILVGLGGIWTEALDDVRLLPAELSRDRIVAELGKLKGARVLAGMRGAPPADVAAVADVVARIGAVMRSQGDVTEVDVNPLVVYPAGKGVLALDALIVTAGAPSH